MSERDTEQLIEDFYRDAASKGSVVLERQKSKDPRIAELLTGKNGKGNKGFPEYILTSPAHVSWVLVVECKKDTGKHESASLDELFSDASKRKAVDFAVDGCLHYMDNLAPEFNVIGLAVSGDQNAHKVSVFVQRKGETATEMADPVSGRIVDSLLSFDQYLSFIDPVAIEQRKKDFDELKKYAKQLHEDCRNHFSLTENQKPLFVSALLLALQESDFRKTYADPNDEDQPKSSTELIEKLLDAIRRVLNKSNVPTEKIATMLSEFNFIANDEGIKKTNPDSKRLYLLEALMALDKIVMPYMRAQMNFDLVGMFYGEFVRYTGGDGKGLGIVLTPRHITELMCKLAGVDADSIVLDPCCGTAGFLISAMSEMIEDAERRELDLTARALRAAQIKKHQLVGVETKGFLYTMAAANMIFRGDGKANLIQGDCFSPVVVSKIRNRKYRKIDFSLADVRDDAIRLFSETEKSENERHATVERKLGNEESGRPNKCLMNPPYSQEKKKKSGENLHELNFILNALDMLAPKGVLVCIVPLSVAFGSEAKNVARRDAILKRHQLDAVLSMPSDLFHPVGTNTCIMVFTAHTPHVKDTWFAYCKDDGHSIDRALGRADMKNRWPSIFETWVSRFKRLDVSDPSFSVLRKVDAKSEWCVEAYMQTDYSNLTQSDFEETVKKFAVFKLLGSSTNELPADSETESSDRKGDGK